MQMIQIDAVAEGDSDGWAWNDAYRLGEVEAGGTCTRSLFETFFDSQIDWDLYSVEEADDYYTLVEVATNRPLFAIELDTNDHPTMENQNV
jgi:hypothetical protein